MYQGPLQDAITILQLSTKHLALYLATKTGITSWPLECYPENSAAPKGKKKCWRLPQ